MLICMHNNYYRGGGIMGRKVGHDSGWGGMPPEFDIFVL